MVSNEWHSDLFSFFPVSGWLEFNFVFNSIRFLNLLSMFVQSKEHGLFWCSVFFVRSFHTFCHFFELSKQKNRRKSAVVKFTGGR